MLDKSEISRRFFSLSPRILLIHILLKRTHLLPTSRGILTQKPTKYNLFFLSFLVEPQGEKRTKKKEVMANRVVEK